MSAERVVRRVAVGVLVVGVAASGVLHHRVGTAEAEDRAGRAAVRAAQTSVPEVLSYVGTHLEDELADEAALMTPSYADRHTAMVRERVLPQATEHEVANELTVVETAVVDAGAREVELLVFANQTTRTREKPHGVTQGARLAVTMRLRDGDWLLHDVRPL